MQLQGKGLKGGKIDYETGIDICTLLYINIYNIYVCHHFRANRWGNNERRYFLGLQITADSDCSHEIKRCLHLGRKTMTSLESVLKSRDISLPTKFHIVKAMVLPVVKYGCESWTIKKAEH